MSGKFLSYIVVRKHVFRLANNVGFFPNKIDITAAASENKKIITRPSKSIYFLLNKVAVATFAIISLLQFIPLICYITVSKHNVGESNSLFRLAVADTVCGIGLPMYIVFQAFFYNDKILELFNNWAIIEMDIIGLQNY